MLKVPPVIVVFENKLNAQFPGSETKADWVALLLVIVELVHNVAWEDGVETVAGGAAKIFEIDFCCTFDKER